MKIIAAIFVKRNLIRALACMDVVFVTGIYVLIALSNWLTVKNK